jgi:predicted tellurium resistance membrane protein TerC
LLDITLSGDNVSVIALAIRNLPEKQAKLASLIGVGGAVGIRILFTCIITLIMAIDWLPIKLIGGFLL